MSADPSALAAASEGGKDGTIEHGSLRYDPATGHRPNSGQASQPGESDRGRRPKIPTPGWRVIMSSMQRATTCEASPTQRLAGLFEVSPCSACGVNFDRPQQDSLGRSISAWVGSQWLLPHRWFCVSKSEGLCGRWSGRPLFRGVSCAALRARRGRHQTPGDRRLRWTTRAWFSVCTSSRCTQVCGYCRSRLLSGRWRVRLRFPGATCRSQRRGGGCQL